MCIRDRVLPDADAFRVDLHELRQGILQAPRDADRSAHREIEVGEFVASHVARGVDACPRLVHWDTEHLGEPLAFQDLAHECLGLPTCLLYTSDAADERSSVDL